MGNFIVSIKRFLGNKNTVTILGVLVGIVVLYLGYNWRVKQAVEPVSVPYAKVAIKGNTLITPEMVGTVKVSKSFVDTTPELITSTAAVLRGANGQGMYVSFDSKIPEGGLFYSSQLKSEKEMPNYVLKGIPKCYTLFYLDVDLNSTYGNAIMPGDYIDLYISATNEEGKLIVAKMIESIEVKDVRDSSGQSIFSSAAESSEPAVLVFAVRDDMFLLLRRAVSVRGNFDVFPVPRNAEYTENHQQTPVASTAIQELIKSRSDTSYDDEFTVDPSCLQSE